MIKFQSLLAELPLIAILRGLQTETAVDVATVLIDFGFRVLEVPLNSPDPFETIGVLVEKFGDRTMIGAGTVMAPDEVTKVAECGGEFIVMPHADTTVVAAAKAQNSTCVPGVSTPTEAFAAIAAGADGLKLFPAEALPPDVVKAWRAVLPHDVPLFPVGGIRPESMSAYLDAGVSGFGLGSALFKPDMPVGDVEANARAFVAAYAALRRGR